MTNQEIQALLDDAVNHLKKTTVGYASHHSPGWESNETTEWWKGLNGISQARAALGAPPPPPPPPPSAVQKPFGILRLGDTYATMSGQEKAGMVAVGIMDADKAAALPGKSIVYMDYFEKAPWFTGVTVPLNPAYFLADELGGYVGDVLLDPSVPGLADELIRNLDAFLSAHKLDGFYTDNCIADWHAFAIDASKMPTKYQTMSNWYSAVQALTIKVGQALKAKGYYVGANMNAFFPGNAGVFPGTDSNNGTSMAQWIKMCAPGLSFVFVENWMRASNGNLRGTAIAWDNYWDAWQSLVRVTQDAGLDFVPSADIDLGGQALAIYTQASFLLDKDDNRGGGTLVNGGTQPYTSWATPVGIALGPKVKTGNVWSRRFDNGSAGVVTVTVDPVARTASIA